MRWFSRFILICALPVVASGCSAEPRAADPSLGAGGMSDEQRSELSDSRVTYDEYQAAFRRFATCLEADGFTVDRIGETNQVIDYRLPEAATTSGASSRCYGREFRHVDARWQVSREDTSAQAAKFKGCLLEAGIEPKSTEREMYDQLVAAGIDTVGCVVN